MVDRPKNDDSRRIGLKNISKRYLYFTNNEIEVKVDDHFAVKLPIIKEAIEGNEIEMLVPSREYTDEEIIYMKGYTQALQDMLSDFDNDFETFLNELIKSQLN